MEKNESKIYDLLGGKEKFLTKIRNIEPEIQTMIFSLLDQLSDSNLQDPKRSNIESYLINYLSHIS